jgi:hypothetical protein
MGADSKLTAATEIAVREAIAFLADVERGSREDAHMLVGTACDARITQLVDGTMGARVMTPERIFARYASARGPRVTGDVVEAGQGLRGPPAYRVPPSGRRPDSCAS